MVAIEVALAQCCFQRPQYQKESTPMKMHISSIRLMLFTMAILGSAFTLPAQAQFICGGSATGNEPQGGGGSTVSGSAFNFACGPAANASGVNGANTAAGNGANASGDGSANTALGRSADAHGNLSDNTATGLFANASGNSSSNIATGRLAVASGDHSSNIATGNRSGDLSCSLYPHDAQRCEPFREL
jgi:hypothetical protein